MNSNRYVRQITLPPIGEAGQARLNQGSVLFVGAGGLSSPAALYLAAAGVGRLGLLDDDVVSLSNLHRQILYATADEGSPKARAALQRLSALNPDIQIEAISERFTPQNAEKMLLQYDLIIDGSDNFPTKFLLNDAALKFGKPWVYGAVNGLEGQTALFLPDSGPCYRCLHPRVPTARIQNCAEAGVLGSVVGTIGTLQATLALQYILAGSSPEHPLRPESGVLSILDFTGAWRFETFKIPPRADCVSCSIPHSEILLPTATHECAIPSREISAPELAQLQQETGTTLCILDVRESEEWESGHLEGALWWPLGRLEAGEFPTFPSNIQKLVVYCRSGMRSAKAAQLLQARAPLPPLNLSGGLGSWQGKLI